MSPVECWPHGLTYEILHIARDGYCLERKNQMSMSSEFFKMYPDSIKLEESFWDDAIIGVLDGEEEMRFVYDRALMVEAYCLHHSCDVDEAEEWIAYNVVRSLPYIKDTVELGSPFDVPPTNDGSTTKAQGGGIEDFVKAFYEMTKPISTEHDPVNHPSHYTRGGIEVIDFLDEYFSDKPYLWQVCKYISRAGYKNSELEDLRKAQFYLNRYIKQKEEVNDNA
jgi:Protein of unknwon function (DUF3310)